MLRGTSSMCLYLACRFSSVYDTEGGWSDRNQTDSSLSQENATNSQEREEYMTRKVALLTAVVMGLGLLMSACGTPAPPPPPEEETIRAAFVYVGPVGDHGWTFAHDQGRQYLEANVDNLETTYLESVSDVDAEARIRDLAEEGYDIIFTTSASFRDATAAVAPEYPDIIFENCSGFLTSENMGSYFGRMYQAKYLAGIVAGMTTETDKIGYVAPIQIPEIIRLINGVTLGARSVNPDVQMEVVWIGNWFDPPAETAAVQSMVDAGVDVIFTGTDTTVPVVTADELGVWSVGYDSCESCDAAPDKCLTTPCWNWGPIYVDLVEAVRDGTWEPDTIY
ncbi:MAG TPA: BMP family ABC transporter substrate-binding protein, partial [Chloroflexi bacterium]|nr:BMP family ABC transporter substrate-binding protein [Chloroflexota bacterium]